MRIEAGTNSDPRPARPAGRPKLGRTSIVVCVVAIAVFTREPKGRGPPQSTAPESALIVAQSGRHVNVTGVGEGLGLLCR